MARGKQTPKKKQDKAAAVKSVIPTQEEASTESEFDFGEVSEEVSESTDLSSSTTDSRSAEPKEMEIDETTMTKLVKKVEKKRTNVNVFILFNLSHFPR